MAEFDLGKMADRVAEKALDEFTYNGKTIREWVEIIVAQDLLAITELEKIKTELHETAEMHLDGDYYLRDEWIDEYIDDHISKLKGVNNA